MAGRSFRQSIVPSYYIDYCRILHRCRGSLILKNCSSEIIWPKSHQAKNNKKLSRYNKGTLYSNIIQVFVKYFLSPLCSDRLAFASLPTYLNLQFFTFSTLIHNKCMHPHFFPYRFEIEHHPLRKHKSNNSTFHNKKYFENSMGYH